MPVTLVPYRTKQLQKVARRLGYDFSKRDERGLYRLVRDCSIPLSSTQKDSKCLSNIMTHRDHLEDRITYVFDMLTNSDEYPLKTMMMIRSKTFDFPFLSLQPVSEAFPPKQRIFKRRRKREIHRIRPESGKIRRSHVIFTTDPDYWPKFEREAGAFASSHTNMFLEVHNFFFFFVMDRRALYTTRLEDFMEKGFAICDRVSRIGH